MISIATPTPLEVDEIPADEIAVILTEITGQQIFSEDEKKILRGQADGCVRCNDLLVILERHFGKDVLTA